MACADAFVWHSENARLAPVAKVNRVAFAEGRVGRTRHHQNHWFRPASVPFERLREQVAKLRFDDAIRSLRVTASFGVAVSKSPGAAGPDELIRAADAALYRAKEAGRNRVVPAPG